jgi:diaminopimelate epimerase
MNKTKRIPFIKMHGAGNDFVFLSSEEMKSVPSKAVVKLLLDRHFGVGGDQLLYLKQGTSVSPPELTFFNADGSEAEMCGNGSRAAAYYLNRFKGVLKDFSFKTKAGLIHIKLKKGHIEVDMGEPILEGKKIPVRKRGEIINVPLKVGQSTYKIHCVSMGNPHCVVFVKNTDKFPVREVGPMIENHPFFPRRVNVEFVQLMGPARAKVRVWERGAGETLACGSGACAVAVAASRIGKTGRKIELNLPGGELGVNWALDNRVYLRGPAEITFSGTFLV